MSILWAVCDGIFEKFNNALALKLLHTSGWTENVSEWKLGIDIDRAVEQKVCIHALYHCE